MQLRITLGWLLIVTAVGCSSARSQVSQVQAEKEQLIAAIKEQKEQLEELRKKNERLAAQLTEAEIEIARGPSFDERRFASQALDKERPGASVAEIVGATTKAITAAGKPAAVAPEAKPAATPSAAAQVAKPLPSEVNSKLPWKPERNTAAAGGASTANSELKTWAAQREWLKFDEAAKSVAVTLPLEFNADGTTLSADSKAKLNELAELLNSGAGKGLRVMVAGQTPPSQAGAAEQRYTNAQNAGSVRAMSVADYLDRSGVASERLGITAVPAEGVTKDQPPRLSIYVLPGDAPIVGWTPPADTIRR